ncbi:unnamed protein product [Rotaria sp. Silwood1]|nr:unnamed protein product [Rotaria sp. Silwood1]CAF3868603.1 unnamed protein product [Rotaria sp. Silwood1]CAF4874007.1 unnamed protein product [Rotaria sp. Silwood1]CAF4947660.1 unnamed protein product [Rotaria sp. Silwood1]
MIFIAHCYEETGQISWKIMSKREKFLYLLNILMKILVFIFSLYLFTLTLDLITSVFILLSRSKFGQIFRSRLFLKNSIISLMFENIITTILQSSSTVTSIIVSMVGSGIVGDAHSVIPMRTLFYDIIIINLLTLYFLFVYYLAANISRPIECT